MHKINNVFIAGAGTMGSGIAQVVAQAGFQVTLYDLKNKFIDRGIAIIKKSLKRLVDKGKKTNEEMEEILQRITPSTSLNTANTADLVIEAVFEDLSVKKDLLNEFDKICKKQAILGSNTSTLPIAALAAGTKNPERIIGIHFMNPVPLMRGVEIIPGMETSEEIVVIVKDFIRSLDKEPVESLDYAGFISSRILDAMLNEAVKCVMEGNKPIEIDKNMKFCCNFPMGPLELIDLVGVDIVLHGLETLHRELGDKYQPAPLLRQMVRAGRLGRKTNKGFYEYNK
ncbi:3-hydroxyacyl-CoA dehydrogenase family protein [Desulfosarcina ovata]|uniref:3-hydroxybutyryl-CoA dehydrogenase n=1 Tax=Desulfosarcina ovata subsp. ovata TaxID=2752305 RepID=A0A5K8A7R1_9BACT|nr:3-hydroxyacyl-CoA dehydrogenase NAD-binding domain-containing protein [Desulfosarcina ovata]BBO88100.1 3-hydroxybutyryl-CoA dehydrogenase [Desulfosarcina ovata subsp. ovata]